jgi:glycosyltransferase involved in cell wall biosynthesis
LGEPFSVILHSFRLFSITDNAFLAYTVVIGRADGSTDDTRHIVASIEDPRLVLVTQLNLEVYAARNATLAIHRGDWLLFLG